MSHTMHTHLLRLGLVTALALLGAAGCSSAKPCPDPHTSPAPTLQPAAQLQAHAQWLSGKTLAVAVIDTQRALDALLSMGFDRPASAAQHATFTARRAALRRDLSALSLARLGVDLTQARGITIGVGAQGVVLVAEGVSYTGEDAETIAGGARAFKAYPRHPADQNSSGMMQVRLWGATLASRPVTVFALERSGVSFALTNTAQSLSARPDRLKRLGALLGARPVALSLAALIEPSSGPAFVVTASPVREASLIVDDRAITLHARSRDPQGASFRQINRSLERLSRSLRLPAAQDAAQDAAPNGTLEAVKIVLNHQADLLDPLKRVVQGDTLHAALPLSALRSRPLTGGIILAALNSQLAHYQSEERQREGERMLRRIAEATVAYARTARPDAQGRQVTCQPPPLAMPTSAVPQNGAAVTPRFDAPGWRELGLGEIKAPQRFAYAILPEPLLKQPTVLIEAYADLKPGGQVQRMHLTVTLTPGPDGQCEVQTSTLRTDHPGQ